MVKKSLLAVAVSLATVATTANADVTIGELAGITGPIAQMAPAIVDGSQMAVDQVNEQGGILDGEKLMLETGDSGCNPQTAVDAATKLVNVSNVVGIIGPNCSGAAINAANTVTIPAGVAIISPSATSPQLTSLEDNDTVYRTAPSDDYQGKVSAQNLLSKGVKKVAISYINNDYGSGLAEAFKATYEAGGGEIAGFEGHEEGKASYRTELAELAKGGADTLVIMDYGDGTGLTILREALENGYFTNFLGSDGMKSNAVIENLGADNLGNFTVTAPVSEQTDASKMFSEAFVARGQAADAIFAPNSYDAAFILALAIQQAGSADRAAVSAAIRDVASAPGEKILPGEWSKAVEAIKSGKGVDYQGATGEHEFDAAGDVSGKIGLFKVDGDTYSQLEVLE